MDVPQFIAGRFRIECKIGTGGMGTVYRATHLGLERPVAVKIIKSEFAGDRDVAERFLREARTMAKLRHPHAAMIFDAGNLPDGRHFIIMEYVDGVTLSEALAREGWFSPEKAVKIAVEICEVLEEAHDLGIIHRDLKPSNIMLNERGVRVLDFGVAKVLASSTEATATHASTGSGQIVGTPRYMSPEQCLGQRVGARSDLYSVGVLLYEMLTGRPPFIDALPSAVLVKQATSPPPPLPHLRPGIPRSLALAVHYLLAKRPDDRPRTAAAARILLERSLLPPQPEVPELDPLSSTVAAVATRPSIFRIGAPVALVMILAVCFLVWASSGETAPPTNANLSSLASNPAISEAQSTLRSRLSAVEKPALRTTSNADNRTLAVSRPVTSRSLTTERARQMAAALFGDSIAEVQVLRTSSGLALAAIYAKPPNATKQFLVMERRGPTFHISSRGPLDKPDFHDAQWVAETLDADNDGYDDVLFTGTDYGPTTPGYRLVLYVPKTGESYCLRAMGSGRVGIPLKVTWSRNALTKQASIYRNVLRDRANSAIVDAITRMRRR